MRRKSGDCCQNPSETRIDGALARAVVYRVLSMGFRPPAANHADREMASRQIGVLRRAMVSIDGGPALAAAVERLFPSSDSGLEAVASSYWRLFGRTARGLVCAFETEYGPDNSFHQPQRLGDVAGFYRAFGFAPTVAIESRPDHIACESEFMDFLSRKEAYLLDRLPAEDSLKETLRVTRIAQRSFVRDHLGRFGRTFAARVAAEDDDGYYGALAALTLAFIDAECARLGIEAGPADLALARIDDRIEEVQVRAR